MSGGSEGVGTTMGWGTTMGGGATMGWGQRGVGAWMRWWTTRGGDIEGVGGSEWEAMRGDGGTTRVDDTKPTANRDRSKTH